MNASAMKLLLPAALLLVQTALFAQDARIDIQSTDMKTGMALSKSSEGVAIGEAGWLGDNKDKRLTSEITVSQDKWTEASFSFIPKTSGDVQIEIMGNWAKEPADKKWFAYADFSVTGATLLNGDFSKLDAQGRPEAWRFINDAALEKVDNVACVKANHDNRVMQVFRVEAGKPVTLKFKVRAK